MQDLWLTPPVFQQLTNGPRTFHFLLVSMVSAGLWVGVAVDNTSFLPGYFQDFLWFWFSEFNCGVCWQGFPWVPPIGVHSASWICMFMSFVGLEKLQTLYPRTQVTFEHMLCLRSFALEWASEVQEPLKLYSKCCQCPLFLEECPQLSLDFSKDSTTLSSFIKGLAWGLIGLFFISLVKTKKS